MKYIPLEVNLLDALEKIDASALHLYCAEDARDLLAREAKQYFEIESQIANKQINILESELSVEDPIPGKVSKEATLENVKHALNILESQSQNIDARIDACLSQVEIVDAKKCESLKESPEEGVIVQLFGDGYSMTGDLIERRTFLGLPEGRDWF